MRRRKWLYAVDVPLFLPSFLLFLDELGRAEFASQKSLAAQQDHGGVHFCMARQLAIDNGKLLPAH